MIFNANALRYADPIQQIDNVIIDDRAVAKLERLIKEQNQSRSGSGFGVGNGGFIEICLADKKVTLLDFAEARNRDPQYQIMETIDFLRHYSYTDLISVFIKRFERRAPHFSFFLLDNILKFYRRGAFINRPIITNIKPETHLSNTGCLYQQAAINFRDKPFWEFNFLIDTGYFHMLDSVNKAGLIVHEVIYERAIEVSSPSALRSFISFLFSQSTVNDPALSDQMILKKANDLGIALEMKLDPFYD